jgi:hypothetical protein
VGGWVGGWLWVDGWVAGWVGGWVAVGRWVDGRVGVGGWVWVVGGFDGQTHINRHAQTVAYLRFPRGDAGQAHHQEVPAKNVLCVCVCVCVCDGVLAGERQR